MINLRNLDLNLLVTLDVLLAERNVTRAARRLNYSQPSVSVHLAKLRDIFGDPLLLPGPRGMQATARAEELLQPLRDALESLERAVTPARPFNPAESEHTWRIAASDSSGSTILLPAMTTIRAAAPETLESIVEFDRYQGKGIPEGRVSISLRLTFRSAERTLTDDEAESAMNAIVEALRTSHNAERR